MHIKYPRTPHLPWSEGRTDDDKVLKNTDHFIGKEVVVTEKMDGENLNWYKDYSHARSIDSKDHPSRHIVKAIHASVGYQIPEKWRICSENMYAMHSIMYKALPSYALLFSVWNEHNHSLSWDDTVAFAKQLGLHTVPVLYRGVWNEKSIKACYTKRSIFEGEQEGYVVRLVDSFSYETFPTSLAKFVRSNHVQTDEHWMNKPVVPNQLKTVI
jgi:hypothetical protein